MPWVRDDPRAPGHHSDAVPMGPEHGAAGVGQRNPCSATCPSAWSTEPADLSGGPARCWLQRLHSSCRSRQSSHVAPASNCWAIQAAARRRTGLLLRPSGRRRATATPGGGAEPSGLRRARPHRRLSRVNVQVEPLPSTSVGSHGLSLGRPLAEVHVEATAGSAFVRLFGTAGLRVCNWRIPVLFQPTPRCSPNERSAIRR